LEIALAAMKKEENRKKRAGAKVDILTAHHKTNVGPKAVRVRRKRIRNVEVQGQAVATV
tara:strand:- start:392 stop:568 length:177 start_codon:yes stop_codon:yes gene_type:complete